MVARVVFLLWCALAVPVCFAAAPAADDYATGPMDALEISVFGIETPGEYTRLAAPVSAEGAIKLPQVGRLPVAGLTTAETDALIRKAYDGRFLKNPRVSTTISQHRSKPVIVTGAVATLGTYYLRRNESTVMDILSLAGDVTEEAGATVLLVSRVKRAL